MFAISIVDSSHSVQRMQIYMFGKGFQSPLLLQILLPLCYRTYDYIFCFFLFIEAVAASYATGTDLGAARRYNRRV